MTPYSAKVTEDEIVFENDLISYVIGADGCNKAFIDKKSGRDYLDKDLQTRFMSIDTGSGYIGAAKVEYKDHCLFVSFDTPEVRARIHVCILPNYLTFELIALNQHSVQEIQLAHIPLKSAEFMSSSLTCTRDRDFAGCILPLNIITASSATRNAFKEAALENVMPVDIAAVSGETERKSNSLVAWCDRRVGLEGGRIALIGCPAGQILDVVEQVEVENGLPHPTIDGVWAKKAKQNRQSYLFIDFSDATVDEVIDWALAGGCGYIMVYDGTWSLSHGSYTINLQNFPGAEAGLKSAIDKIHAAGLRAGVHSLDRVVTKTDPLVHPVPDPGLLKRRENERTLERDLEAFEQFIPATTSPRGLLDKAGKHRHYSRDLLIDDEIITYDDIQTEPPYGFTGCTRGAYGTHPTPHKSGARIENFAEFIGFFEPDVESDLYDRVVRNLARVIDECGFDMIYPDGIGENLAHYGKEPAWYINNLAVSKLYYYVQRDMLWAHGPVSNWSWHVFARGNTTDFVTRGMVEHFDIVSVGGGLSNQVNLQPNEFGWFGFFGKEIDRDATRPREVEYAYAKTCAYDCAMSLETNLATLKANGRTAEIFAIMKEWEELKLEHYFSASVLEKIREKGVEFTLDRDGQGKRVARPIVYGPEHYSDQLDGVDNRWNFENTFASQPLRLSITSMPTLAAYGKSENKVLFRPGELAFETSPQGPLGQGRNSEGTVFDLAVSQEQVKVDDGSFKATATNHSETSDGWGCVEIVLDQVQDMRTHRALGTWVYGDDSGVPLHFVVEDASRWAVRDWWVRLDFKGWKYVVVPEPARGEVYGFNYPYSNYWSIRHFNYSQAARVYVFLTNIPPQQSATCYFTRLEALQELPGTIEHPRITIGSQTLTFPVVLETEDYLECAGCGSFRAFNAHGFTTAEAKVQGDVPVLEAGSNAVAFDCAGTDSHGQAVKVEIITLGEPPK